MGVCTEKALESKNGQIFEIIIILLLLHFCVSLEVILATIFLLFPIKCLFIHSNKICFSIVKKIGLIVVKDNKKCMLIIKLCLYGSIYKNGS
jgi:hypothetical protein